ncbi:MAG: hypothetical protein ACYDHX_08070 [Methanothrix sp.]
MKFTPPTDPGQTAQMYEAMLGRVAEARLQIRAYMAQIEPEMARLMATNQDARELYQTKKKLHLQELCLEDQERRLEGALASL